MNKRTELQNILERINGISKVYFQPPASVSLTYPCVIYNLENGDTRYADNKMYNFINKYQLTFIYKKVSLTIIEDVLSLFEMCKCDKVFVSDNLYHYVFTLYY